MFQRRLVPFQPCYLEEIERKLERSGSEHVEQGHLCAPGAEQIFKHAVRICLHRCSLGLCEHYGASFTFG